MAAATGLKRLVRGPARAVRRYLTPEYEGLLRDNRLAFESLAAAHGAIAHLQEQERILRERFDAVDRRAAELEDGLLEARRLNLRVAQLTDVVTEVVLPLHDRDIDPAKFDRLAPDTL